MQETIFCSKWNVHYTQMAVWPTRLGNGKSEITWIKKGTLWVPRFYDFFIFSVVMLNHRHHHSLHVWVSDHAIGKAEKWIGFQCIHGNSLDNESVNLLLWKVASAWLIRVSAHVSDVLVKKISPSSIYKSSTFECAVTGDATWCCAPVMLVVFWCPWFLFLMWMLLCCSLTLQSSCSYVKSTLNKTFLLVGGNREPSCCIHCEKMLVVLIYYCGWKKEKEK